MAQRVNVVLVDDIDGSDAVETVTFGLDGVTYDIDLSEAHASEFRKALAPYIGHGRKASGPRRGAKAATRSSKSAAGGTSAAEIRTWARANGWDVPDRGRVSAEVRGAYAAAH
jgi:hypothetical protein